MKHSKLKYSKKMPAFSANFGKMEHPGDGQCSLFDSWTNKVMRLLPHDFTITFDEVKSEIVKHCIDLSKSFDGSKGSDYIAYCAKYAPKSARKAIMKEYERMKKNVSFVNDYDDNGDDSLSDWKVLQSELFDTPAHFDGDACFALDKQAQRRERDELIKLVIEAAEALGKCYVQLIKILLDGKTQADVAKLFKVSRQTISKMFNEIKKKSHEYEDEADDSLKDV